jgi:tripartite-type tricarboxylate transporter receptor subunit TctC
MRKVFDGSRRWMMASLAGWMATGVLGDRRGAIADAGYPDRPVKLLVPFAAGGPIDVMARLIANTLSEHLGKSFFVDNQGGAGGNIGMGAAARAAPDGFTVLVVSSSFVINPGVYRHIPYDAAKDFTPITIAADSPHVFIVHPSVPAKSIRGLVDLIRAEPGRYNYASPGAGTGPHLSAELFKLTFGLDLTHVPFRGAGPAVQSVAGGHNPIGCVALPAAVPLLDAGQIKALAVTSRMRFPSVPGVPTMAEQGIEGQEGSTIAGFLVPANTSRVIVDFLYQQIVAIVNAPGVKDRLVELGFTPVLSTPEQFAGYIPIEMARWTQVVRVARLETQ